MAVALDDELLGRAHSADLGDPAHIIAPQIQQHQMLGQLLLGCSVDGAELVNQHVENLLGLLFATELEIDGDRFARRRRAASIRPKRALIVNERRLLLPQTAGQVAHAFESLTSIYWLFEQAREALQRRERCLNVARGLLQTSPRPEDAPVQLGALGALFCPGQQSESGLLLASHSDHEGGNAINNSAHRIVAPGEGEGTPKGRGCCSTLLGGDGGVGR